jgi:cytidylate kinase
MAVVTISSEMGSGAPEIGALLAKRLGYRLIDREVITEAARRYDLREAKLADLDGRKPSLFQRFDVETRRYILGTHAALCEFAEADDVVLMGRGGQWLLRTVPHVLRVRVVAPFEDRVERLARRAGHDTPPRALVDLVRRDDAGRAGRTRYLYDVDIDDAALYDVVINTATLTVEGAVDLLTVLVQQPELATTPAGRALVSNRALSARVEVALATDSKTRKLAINVQSEDGVVTLEGASDLGYAVTVARKVPGVTQVRSRQTEPASIPSFPG